MLSGRFADVYNLSAMGTLQNQLCPSTQGRLLPLFLPPVLVWLCTPLAFLPYQLSFVIWTALLCVSLTLALLLIGRSFALSGRALIWAAAIFGASGPCMECIRVGQPSAFFLLGLAAAIHFWKEKKYSLVACGQSILWLKPHLLLPLLAFQAGCGSMRSWATTIAIGLAGFAISLLIGGSSVINSYCQMISSNQARQYMGLNGPTLSRQLVGLGVLNEAQIDAISLSFYALLLLAGYLIGKVQCSNQRQLVLLVSVLIPLALAFAPYLQNYDVILLLPGVLAVFKQEQSTREAKRMIALTAGIVSLFSLPVYVYVHYFYISKGGLFHFFFWSLCFWAWGVFTWAKGSDSTFKTAKKGM